MAEAASRVCSSEVWPRKFCERRPVRSCWRECAKRIEMKIDLGARVLTRDEHEVGEVHRVVVDIDNEAVVAVVVLKGRLLSRDILVPIDFVDSADGNVVRL